MRPFIYSLIGLFGFGSGACAQQAPTSVDAGQMAKRLRIESQNPQPGMDGVSIQSDPDNLYTIEKTPGSGSMKLKQDGRANEADMLQEGGSDNHMEIEQRGHGNRATGRSSGSGNSIIIRQSN